MQRKIVIHIALLISALPVFAGSLGTAARSVIPGDVQQIINVDYRRMKNSETAMALKAKLLPPNMKQFEDALKSIGVEPDRDLEQITIASFRTKKNGLLQVGVAQGQFPRKKLRLNLTKQKIKGQQEGDNVIYTMAGGMQMTFLDDWTMLFGTQLAVEAALEARDNSGLSLNSNSEITDMMASVSQGTVWSVLDAGGTQVMMKSALGAAADLGEFDTVKKRLLGSRYSLDFDHGVDFDLNVVTSDNMTSATMASLLKAGLMYKKASANPTEKGAIDGTRVDSSGGSLIVHFKADDKSFQSLLDSPMFASVTH
jgi:hypothetical protein